MQTSRNYFFAALPRHDAGYSSTSWQLARELAASHRVFYLDHPFTWLDLIRSPFNRNIWKRLRSGFSGAPVVYGVTVIMAPLVWPINFLPAGRLHSWMLKVNQKRVARRVNRVLRKAQINELIYINSFEFYLPELRYFLQSQVTLAVYQCLDPMVKAVTRRHGIQLQQLVAQNSELVVCTSPALMDQFKSHPRVAYVPNGGNFELFGTVEPETRERRNTPHRQIMGYLGNIERRMDYELLAKVLELLEDWELHLVGPMEVDHVPADFRNHPRVIFAGPVAQSEAPAQVARFDVALIPFRVTEASRGIFPLKLYEYFATGCPVVTTPFNPGILEPMSKVLGIGATPEEFAAEILRQHALDSRERRNTRRQLAAENSWKSRAQLLTRLVDEQVHS